MTARSIRIKLFLTFLLTTLLLVSGMYAFMRWSLDRGFNEFIKSRQQERVSTLIETLSDYYGHDPDWEKLAANKQLWIDLLWQSDHRRHRPPPILIERAQSEPSGYWPPAMPENSMNRRYTPFQLRVMLLRADRKIIYGRVDAIEQLEKLEPIHYQNGIVGYLGILPGKTPSQPGELRFIEGQAKAFVWIALLMILLSAFLAWLLAYMLGRPLKRITTAAKALAIGRYDVRLPVESSDELGHLARDFNELATALERSEQSRRRWVADISHELRTPLAVLHGELEALQDGIRPLTAEAVDSLLGDVMRLNRLTEDLYQLALSDQGALSYRKQSLDPIPVLQEDIAALSPEFDNRQIRLQLLNRLTKTVHIHADPDRLSQLFRNLLSNSAKYTDAGGCLKIVVIQKSGLLIIEFADSAPGISEQEIRHLFDRFYRVESSRSRHHGGAGLGLAICANIAHAHNGTITAGKSKLGGLNIRIALPLIS
ncbi:MAG: HAMP domain-containing protein [Gammaproteobacteria bacterium]|nr:HAMP domain-containing protein [Gammaproteobacteria bacterium]